MRWAWHVLSAGGRASVPSVVTRFCRAEQRQNQSRQTEDEDDDEGDTADGASDDAEDDAEDGEAEQGGDVEGEQKESSRAGSCGVSFVARRARGQRLKPVRQSTAGDLKKPC